MANYSTQRLVPPIVNGLAIMWLATGSIHASSISRFARDICDYALIPCSMAIIAAPCLAAFHIILGGQLLIGSFLKPALAASLCLLGIYTAAGILALGKGLDISCGCMGAYSLKVSWTHVLINTLLLAVVAMAMFSSHQNKVATHD